MRPFEIRDIISGKPSFGGYFEPGTSIKQVKFTYGLERENCQQYVNSVLADESYILQEGDSLRFDIIPAGGSAKNWLLGALALATGGLVASSLGLATGSWGYVAVQSIAASALSKSWISGPQLSAPTSYEQDPRNELISSQNNEYRLNRAIPVVLGNRVYAPPKAALDFAEISGNDYYYNILLCPGYGRLDISELKIGETDIEDYDGLTYLIVEKKDENTRFSYFDKDVYEETVGAQLSDEYSTIRTTQADTDKISVDLSFPQGLVQFNNENAKLAQSVQLYFEYRENPTEGSPGPWKHFQNSVNLKLTDGITGLDNEVTSWGSDQINVIVDPTDSTRAYITNNYDTWLQYPPFANGDTITLSGSSAGNDGSYTVIYPRYPSPGQGIFKNTNGIYVQKSSGTVSSEGRQNITFSKIVSQTPYLQITDTNTSAVRKNISFSTGKNSRWDVRIIRKDAESEDIKIKNRVDWAILRSINTDINAGLVPDDLAYIEIRIKATDQLQGAVDNITCRCKSYLPVWDDVSETWSYEISRNPAWAAIHMLKDENINPEPATDSIIDLDSFVDWADWCDTNEYYFDAVLDGERGLTEVLHDIATAGRASIFVYKGKWTVVQDTEQTIPKYMITPRNILKDSYSFSKSFKKNVQCLKIRFVDDNNKEDEYPVCIDGYGIPESPGYTPGDLYPEEIEDMTFFGVKEPDQIWKLGRKILNNTMLQPFIHSWEMDMEHYNLKKGDRVIFSHDLMRYDLARGRILSVTENGSSEVESVLVDEACEMLAGESYVFSYMRENKVIVQTRAIETDADNRYSILFSTPIATEKPAAGNYFVFGSGEVDLKNLQITSIEPGNDRIAKLTATNYDAAVFDLGTTPTYESNITVQDEVIREVPPIPQIDSVVSDESVLQRLGNGTLVSRILLNIKQDSGNGIQPEYYQAQYRESGATNWKTEPAVSADSKALYISGVDDAVTYQVRVRSIYRNNASDWCTYIEETVIGKTTPPKNVTGFTVYIAGEHLVMEWDELSELDISEYLIREKNTDWDDSTPFVSVDSNKIMLKNNIAGTGERTYLIKAKDVTGLTSETEAEASITILSPTTPVLKPTVELNKVFMDWQDCGTSFPIKTYKFRKGGSSWETAKIINDALGPITFYSTSEGVSGVKTYRVKAVDTAGNVSAEGTVQIPVGDAYSFKLYDTNIQEDFSGATLENAIVDPDGSVILPVNTTETWQEHFDSRSWDNWDDQVAAGYPYYIQPAYDSPGYVEFSFDIGDEVSEAQIDTELDPLMVDNPEISIRTSVSDDNVNWTDYESGKVYVSDEFQYVKIRVTVTADPDTEVVQINRVFTRVQLEEKIESGTTDITSYNQQVDFVIENFNVVDSVAVTLADSFEPVIISIVDVYDTANPTYFKVRVWDTAGYEMGEAGYSGPATVKIDWTAKGK